MYGYLWVYLAKSTLSTGINAPSAERISIAPDKVFVPGGAVNRWTGFPLRYLVGDNSAAKAEFAIIEHGRLAGSGAFDGLRKN